MNEGKRKNASGHLYRQMNSKEKEQEQEEKINMCSIDGMENVSCNDYSIGIRYSING